MGRLWRWADALYGFYESPAGAAAAWGERAPAGLGIAAFMLCGVSLVVSQSLVGGAARHLFGLMPWAVVLAGAALAPVVFGFLAAGVFHLTAEMLGAARGSARGLFVLLGLSDFLYVLYLPLVFATEVFLPGAELLRGLGFAALTLGAFALKVASVRGNYGLGAGRAVVVVFLPYAAAVLLGLAALGALGVSLAARLMS